MKITPIFIAIVTTSIVVVGGFLVVTPFLFAGRVGPGLQAGMHTMTGVSNKDVPSMIDAFEREIVSQVLTFNLGENEVKFELKELGILLDKESIIETIKANNLRDVITKESSIKPIPAIDDTKLSKVLSLAFTESINGPQNATLRFDAAGKLELVPSVAGEVIDLERLKTDLNILVVNQDWDEPITLSLVTDVAEVQDNETASALEYANKILREGIELTFGEESIPVKPFTIRRLIRFVEQVDPTNHNNFILGVKFDSTELSSYLTTTVVPVIDQPAQNARFVLNEERVEQFSLPSEGRALDIPATASSIAAKLAKHERVVELVAAISEPVFSNIDDIEKLGLTEQLSSGESDFVGSPKNRVHNITVGASKYHGLLIPPNTEFSFNEFLGPVNAATGFKPELVIKSNVTTPEYGGGLCQVSTTLFRAALNSGLEITQRRNHSYAVSYYGKPGLDATIYPPYTDLRFLNNTPGYILIQTRIDGTKIAFDFWGTNDDRKVEVTGPIAYDRQSNGAVKAYVDQLVTLADEVIIDKTFYSRYKSPKLFPKVLAANGEGPVQIDASKDKAVDTKEEELIKTKNEPTTPTTTKTTTTAIKPTKPTELPSATSGD
jgi:vancomycin resistance protein YoaR